MHKVKELTIGVIIFFIIERAALLVSCNVVEKTADLEVACRRAMIELVFLIVLLGAVWRLLKA